MEQLQKAYNSFYGITHNLSFTDYVAFNYKGYCATCTRCGIEPKTLANWIGA